MTRTIRRLATAATGAAALLLAGGLGAQPATAAPSPVHGAGCTGEMQAWAELNSSPLHPGRVYYRVEIRNPGTGCAPQNRPVAQAWLECPTSGMSGVHTDTSWRDAGDGGNADARESHLVLRGETCTAYGRIGVKTPDNRLFLGPRFSLSVR